MNEKEVSDFKFRRRRGVDFGALGVAPSSARCSLLATSSEYGLSFVGCKPGVYVFSMASLAAATRDKHRGGWDVNVDAATLHPLLLPTPVPPQDVALSSDGLTLSVAYQQPGPTVAFYDVRTLKGGAVAPFCSIQLSTQGGVLLNTLHWNPANPEVLAVCLSSGAIAVLEVKQTVSVLSTKPMAANSICWSPRGKQLAVGLRDGGIQQLSPKTLEVKRSLPAPQTSPLQVIDLHWVATFVFAAVYMAQDPSHDQTPSLQFVLAPKEAQVTFMDCDDVYFGTGKKPDKFYFSFISKWGILVSISANAVESAVFYHHANDVMSWEQWELEDTARAEFPLTADKDFTFAAGLALDYSSQEEVPIIESDLLPPCPLLLLYSDHGILCPYTVVNTRLPPQAIKLLVQPPKPLPPPREREEEAKAASISAPPPSTPRPFLAKALPTPSPAIASGGGGSGLQMLPPSLTQVSKPLLLPAAKPSLPSQQLPGVRQPVPLPSQLPPGARQSPLLVAPAPSATALSQGDRLSQANQPVVMAAPLHSSTPLTTSQPLKASTSQLAALLTSQQQGTAMPPAAAVRLAAVTRTGLPTSGTGLVTPKTDLATPGVGLATQKTGLATSGTGLVTPKTDLVTPGVGLAAQRTGLATSATCLTTPGAGLTTLGAGLVTPGEGQVAPKVPQLRSGHDKQPPPSSKPLSTSGRGQSKERSTLNAKELETKFSENIAEEIDTFVQGLETFKEEYEKDFHRLDRSTGLSTSADREDFEGMREILQHTAAGLEQCKQSVKTSEQKMFLIKQDYIEELEQIRDMTAHLKKRHDEHYSTLQRSRLLDPYSARRLNKVRSLLLQIEQMIWEIHAQLDSGLKKRHAKRRDAIATPSAHSVYTTARRQDKVVQMQAASLDRLTNTMKALKLIPQSWQPPVVVAETPPPSAQPSFISQTPPYTPHTPHNTPHTRHTRHTPHTPHTAQTKPSLSPPKERFSPQRTRALREFLRSLDRPVRTIEATGLSLSESGDSDTPLPSQSGADSYIGSDMHGLLPACPLTPDDAASSLQSSSYSLNPLHMPRPLHGSHSSVNSGASDTSSRPGVVMGSKAEIAVRTSEGYVSVPQKGTPTPVAARALLASATPASSAAAEVSGGQGIIAPGATDAAGHWPQPHPPGWQTRASQEPQKLATPFHGVTHPSHPHTLTYGSPPVTTKPGTPPKPPVSIAPPPSLSFSSLSSLNALQNGSSGVSEPDCALKRTDPLADLSRIKKNGSGPTKSGLSTPISAVSAPNIALPTTVQALPMPTLSSVLSPSVTSSTKPVSSSSSVPPASTPLLLKLQTALATSAATSTQQPDKPSTATKPQEAVQSTTASATDNNSKFPSFFKSVSLPHPTPSSLLATSTAAGGGSLFANMPPSNIKDGPMFQFAKTSGSSALNFSGFSGVSGDSKPAFSFAVSSSNLPSAGSPSSGTNKATTSTPSFPGFTLGSTTSTASAGPAGFNFTTATAPSTRPMFQLDSIKSFSGKSKDGQVVLDGAKGPSEASKQPPVSQSQKPPVDFTLTKLTSEGERSKAFSDIPKASTSQPPFPPPYLPPPPPGPPSDEKQETDGATPGRPDTKQESKAPPTTLSKTAAGASLISPPLSAPQMSTAAPPSLKTSGPAPPTIPVPSANTVPTAATQPSTMATTALPISAPSTTKVTSSSSAVTSTPVATSTTTPNASVAAVPTSSVVITGLPSSTIPAAATSSFPQASSSSIVGGAGMGTGGLLQNIVRSTDGGLEGEDDGMGDDGMEDALVGDQQTQADGGIALEGLGGLGGHPSNSPSVNPFSHPSSSLFSLSAGMPAAVSMGGGTGSILKPASFGGLAASPLKPSSGMNTPFGASGLSGMSAGSSSLSTQIGGGGSVFGGTPAFGSAPLFGQGLSPPTLSAPSGVRIFGSSNTASSQPGVAGGSDLSFGGLAQGNTPGFGGAGLGGGGVGGGGGGGGGGGEGGSFSTSGAGPNMGTSFSSYRS